MLALLRHFYAPERHHEETRIMTIKLGYLLIDGFALMSYAPVIEPFRAANRLSGTEHYSWRHYSVTGANAHASNGIAVSVDGSVNAMETPDILFVCAGGNPALFRDRQTFDVLRRAARFGTRIAGVSGGPFILARAGLLDGYRCTVHWEHEAAFVETFTAPILERALYVIDTNRITCAGGLAGLDLAAELIGTEHGALLSSNVSDWYIQTERRQASRPQRRAAAQRLNVSHRGLAAVLAEMDEEPLRRTDRAALAKVAGVSVRQLERLFLAKLGTTIGAHALQLRLEHARRLLRETGMTITEIAETCNFSSVSHFSRQFRSHYALPPSKVRGRSGGNDLQRTNSNLRSSEHQS